MLLLYLQFLMDTQALENNCVFFLRLFFQKCFPNEMNKNGLIGWFLL